MEIKVSATINIKSHTLLEYKEQKENFKYFLKAMQGLQ